MLIESIVLSCVIALLKRGKISNIKEINKLPMAFLFIIGMIHTVLITSEKLNISIINNYIIENLYYIKISLYLGILLVLLFNIKSSKMAIWLIIIGLTLNATVILVNKDIIDKEASNNRISYSFKVNKLDPNEIKLPLLLYEIKLPTQYPFREKVSLADIFIAVGLFLYIQDIMSRKRKYVFFS